MPIHRRLGLLLRMDTTYPRRSYALLFLQDAAKRNKEAYGTSLSELTSIFCYRPHNLQSADNIYGGEMFWIIDLLHAINGSLLLMYEGTSMKHKRFRVLHMRQLSPALHSPG